MYSTIMKTDFYKLTHLAQYRPELTHFTSYLTPRSSRLKNIDKMVFFGLSSFCYKYLYKDFNETFFDVPVDRIKQEYYEALVNGLGYDIEAVDKTLEKVLALHELGYLPIEVNALPEGALVPMQVPAIEIRSTHKDFCFVAQSIESLLSCLIWHPSMSATVGYEYGKIVKYYYDMTVDNADTWKRGCCDFSMRGQESYESAVNSSLGWLTTFYNSSTVGARFEIKEIYEDVEPVIVGGLTSTEHSVMTSDFAICGDERETYRRLLTEVYPKTSFAAVADSYDFWRIATEVLPSLRKEIEEHEGFIGLRHDCYTESAQVLTPKGWKYIKDLSMEDKVAQFNEDDESIEFVSPLKIINEPYEGDMYHFYNEKWNIETTVTPNHRMVRKRRSDEKIQIIHADKIKYYDGMGLIRHGFKKGTISHLTPLDRLMIAYQADGNVSDIALNKQEQFERGYTIRFQFSKERKIERLIEICKEGNFEYWIRDGYKPHKNSQKDETTINVKIYTKPIKHFADWVDLSDKDCNWCKEFCDEISYWDSRVRKDRPCITEYVNTFIQDAEIAQAIGVLAGYNTHFAIREDNRAEHYLNCAYMTINSGSLQPCYAVKKEKIENWKGNIYCVNVPSGLLVVRENGQVFISGNSAEPVSALCGIPILDMNDKIKVCHDHVINEIEEKILDWADEHVKYILDTYGHDFEIRVKYMEFDGIYKIYQRIYIDGRNETAWEWEVKFLRDTTYEDKGMVETLYKFFGGNKNSKGYIELNPKVKAVYGDSITIQRARKIYENLASKGFAANCVSLGVGSFSMEAIEEEKTLKPFTRDTFSIAIKATYGKTSDGKELQIFKDPKNFSGKKSLKGLCVPYWENGELKVKSELNENEVKDFEKISAFYPYFKNGNLYRTRFNDIRERINKNLEMEKI